MIAAFLLVAFVATVLMVFGFLRAYKSNDRWVKVRNNGLGALGVLLVIAFLAVVLVTNNDDEAAAGTNISQTSEDKASATVSANDCKDLKVSFDDPKWGYEDEKTQVFAATGGELVGNGPPLDTTSAGTALEDVLTRVTEDPQMAATLAYGMRLKGFTQQDVTADHPEGTMSPVPLASEDVSFLSSRVAGLVKSKKLWQQTAVEICQRLSREEVSLDADPYKDSDVSEIASRKVDTEAEGITLPLASVFLSRTTQPDGVRLLWLNRSVDNETGERPNYLPLAIDVQFGWVVIIGSLPQAVEVPAPPTPEQIQQDAAFQQGEQQKAGERNGGKDNSGGGSGTTDGKGGGNNADQHNGDTNGCFGDCGHGSTDSGNGSGNGDGGGTGGGGSCGTGCPGNGGGTDCGSSCPGTGGGTGSGPGCGTCGGTTPTTVKPTTTTQPPAPPTTARPTTTTQPPAPPTTVRPTTTTTSPPPPATTTTLKATPPPECNPNVPPDIPGGCPA